MAPGGSRFQKDKLTVNYLAFAGGVTLVTPHVEKLAKRQLFSHNLHLNKVVLRFVINNTDAITNIRDAPTRFHWGNQYSVRILHSDTLENR